MVLLSATPGATLYYAVNAAPDASSTVYNGPIPVASSETIEAIAIAPGFSVSPVVTASYTIWPSSAPNQWAWMSGATRNVSTFPINPNIGVNGIYGVLGVPAADNTPGPRLHSATWTDSSGNLWLFGGYGADKNGILGYLNDLWKFNPSTREWTWTGGSQSFGAEETCWFGECAGQPGVYGTKATPAAANVPGGRENPTSWTDANGNFWLFGGYGFDAVGTLVYLNDLWEYDPTTNQWTWMGGPNAFSGTCFPGILDGFFCSGDPGAYGTLRTAAPGNLPAARYQATGWVDGTGNFWLFGGYTVTPYVGEYVYNDLWKFSPSSHEWTWMGGSNNPAASNGVFDPNSALEVISGYPGVYGTLGSPSPPSMPGGRRLATGWTDRTGNLWLAGGTSFDANTNYDSLNDIWKFSPSTNQWTWMGGATIWHRCAMPILTTRVVG